MAGTTKVSSSFSLPGLLEGTVVRDCLSLGGFRLGEAAGDAGDLPIGDLMVGEGMLDSLAWDTCPGLVLGAVRRGDASSVGLGVFVLDLRVSGLGASVPG